MSNLNIPEGMMEAVAAMTADLEPREQEAKPVEDSLVEDTLQQDDEGGLETTAKDIVQEDEIDVSLDDLVAEISDDYSQEDEHQEEEEEAPSQELSAIEEEAMKMGWKPKSEYKDDPEDFVEAEFYVDRAPFIKSNQKLKRELEEVKAGMRELARSVSSAENRGRENALKELLVEKRLAYQTGNYGKANQLEADHQKMMEENVAQHSNDSDDSQEYDAPAGEEVDVAGDPAWISFAEKNSWIGSDEPQDVPLRLKASKLAKEYIDTVGEDKFTQANVAKMTAYIEQEMRPKASTPSSAQRRPAAVSKSGSRSSKQAKSHKIHNDWNKLDPAQKLAAQFCLEEGSQDSVNDYIDSLKKSGQLDADRK